MQFYVYVIFRPNGSPCYVGKGSGDRWLHHERKTSNRHLGRIIAKACEELPKVKVREGLAEAEAFEIERALIAAIGREKNGGPLVNATDGGDGVLNPSDEVRAKMSAKAKTPERTAHMRRLGAMSKGKKRSPEFCAAVARGHLGKKHSPGHRAAQSAGLKGKPKTEAHKAALRVAKRPHLKGPISDTRRQSIRRALLAFWDFRRQQGLSLRHPREERV